MNSKIKIVLYLTLIIIVPLILSFWIDRIIINIYYLSLGTLLIFFNKRETNFIKALPFIIALLLIVFPLVQNFFSPIPEVHVSINRIFRFLPEDQNINGVHLPHSYDAQLFLISSKKILEEQTIVVKEGIIPGERFFFGIEESKNPDVPITYLVHIKNEGKAKTKEDVSGSIYLTSEKIICKEDYSPQLELTCQKSSNPYQDSIFFKSKDILEEEQQLQFIFRTNKLEIPQVNCKYDNKKCNIGIYNLRIIPVKTFPFYFEYGDKRVWIPDHRGKNEVLIYNTEENKWMDYPKFINGEIGGEIFNS